ncbi:MAG: hypothetical protein SO435_04595 [Peptostreptococcus porci]|nr:hypothetical protein [Peptostreptococcus porci]
MNYLEIKNILNEFAKSDYKELIKAILSFELKIEDENTLEKMYSTFMKNDDFSLLNDDFLKRF